jgi:hypothetical protein
MRLRSARARFKEAATGVLLKLALPAANLPALFGPCGGQAAFDAAEGIA